MTELEQSNPDDGSSSIFKDSSVAWILASIITDRDERPVDCFCIDVSDAFCLLVRSSKDILKNRSLLTVFPFADEIFRNWLVRRDTSSDFNSSIDYEEYIPLTDIWCSISLICSPGKRILGIVTDITWKKRLQASFCALEKRTMSRDEALLEELDPVVTNDMSLSESFKQNIYQSVAQPILFLDRKRKIINCNAAFVRLFGYTLQELHGLSFSVLEAKILVYERFGYTPQQYASILDRLWRDSANLAVRKAEDVIVLSAKGGGPILLELSINGLFSETGEHYGYAVFPLEGSQRQQRHDLGQVSLFQSLTELAELRDADGCDHLRRVGRISGAIAAQLTLPELFCRRIELFAPMHDIGKVGINDSILRVPRKLTSDEFEIMKTHTSLGFSILKDKAGLEMAAEITLHHHERFDGSGYPDGLSGYGISVAAQITGVADVYDALRSSRPYKHGWGHEKSLQYIRDGSTTLFNPEIVEAFCAQEHRMRALYDELS